MRVLITGGAGFIGHHTLEHLLATTDWEFVVLDGLTYAGDVNRVIDIEGYRRDRVAIHWHDLRAPIGDRLDSAIGYIDVVINMASNTHIDRSIASPTPFIRDNVDLILNMADWGTNRCDKFIHISTDEVYGPAPEGHPGFGEWSRIIPSNPYSASKAAQEAVVIAYWRTYNLPLIVTNTMNNFGERQFPEKLIPRTIANHLIGKSTPLFASYKAGEFETAKRTWLHAKNHADALKFIIENVEVRYFGEVDRPERFNVVGDFEVDNETLVKMIANFMNVEPLYNYVRESEARPGHDKRYALDGSRLRTRGWVAPVPTEEALEKTVKWFMNNKEWLNLGNE